MTWQAAVLVFPSRCLPHHSSLFPVSFPFFLLSWDKLWAYSETLLVTCILGLGSLLCAFSLLHALIPAHHYPAWPWPFPGSFVLQHTSMLQHFLPFSSLPALPTSTTSLQAAPPPKQHAPGISSPKGCLVLLLPPPPRLCHETGTATCLGHPSPSLFRHSPTHLVVGHMCWGQHSPELHLPSLLVVVWVVGTRQDNRLNDSAALYFPSFDDGTFGLVVRVVYYKHAFSVYSSVSPSYPHISTPVRARVKAATRRWFHTRDTTAVVC